MSLAPLVTQAQIEARLGRALTAAEDARIDALIADVSAAVRSDTGQDITVVTTTNGLMKTHGRTVRLPQRPVTAVATVKDTDGNDLTFTWINGDDRFSLGSTWYLNVFELNIPATGTVSKVRVTYTHGYATVPDDIVAVVCAVVVRSLLLPLDSSGLIQESIAGYSYSMSVTLAEAANARAFGLLDNERDILNKYRRPTGAISLLT